MSALIEAKGVTKVLGRESGGVATEVLKGVDVTIEKGEFTAIVGPSGSGKSTLLYLLGLLDRPTAGTVRFNGRTIQDIGQAELSKVRNEQIGFIYQFHFLLPEFSALENVTIPMMARARISPAKAKSKAMEILESMDMKEHANKRPNQLSGGQQQRVAIARAMANQPLAIFGDEPTGNLDTKNSCAIFELFEKLNREQGQTLVIVTHDRELAGRAHRLIKVRDGLIEE